MVEDFDWFDDLDGDVFTRSHREKLRDDIDNINKIHDRDELIALQARVSEAIAGIRADLATFRMRYENSTPPESALEWFRHANFALNMNNTAMKRIDGRKHWMENKRATEKNKELETAKAYAGAAKQREKTRRSHMSWVLHALEERGYVSRELILSLFEESKRMSDEERVASQSDTGDEE